ncbi:type II toxin-antitoxin system RelB/DinJ family antitoxin [Geovibrio thiophilus]|uniref:Type II toxin-antitoxin system RelB/DinJ family antitoxin n=1 Tax=Geovibrio thiophilus TaxID=139438 RepID=A0A3R5Y5L9_9BACT|nr:type II toxin-antitoxin system RelB/DinJ family antitoxin [Geovibrio thiophilus]QAR32259.1 type II toxin-antitoxin system RelB/DinJ family antitoxin [Geovibrio thiophilus]
MPKTSMLHVRIEEDLKAEAAETLANFGLTVSDAVRILLTRIVKEGALPIGLTSDPEAYDLWFHAKVREALESTKSEEHKEVMNKAQILINRKKCAY